ncbi:MAG: PilZ domain-containing protein [Cyanobacterium sp. T60_A2020_053]|nr:PilZ domain-containing protein [Cyanobacterium sp. T60_A2020_053]
MDSTNEKRFNRRILAVCRVLDENKNFLGFTLDLTVEGIQLIVNKNFPLQEQFVIVLSQNVNDEDSSYQEITVTIKQKWRSETNEEYDQIGGEIIAVDLPEELSKLVKFCDEKAKEKYQFDLKLV